MNVTHSHWPLKSENKIALSDIFHPWLRLISRIVGEEWELFFTELFTKSRKKSLKNWNKLHVKKEHQQSLMNCHIWTTGYSNVAPPLTKKIIILLPFTFPAMCFSCFYIFLGLKFLPLQQLSDCFSLIHLFLNLLKISQANIFMKFTISFSCFLLANETYLLSLLEIWVKKKRFKMK